MAYTKRPKPPVPYPQRWAVLSEFLLPELCGLCLSFLGSGQVSRQTVELPHEKPFLVLTPLEVDCAAIHRMGAPSLLVHSRYGLLQEEPSPPPTKEDCSFLMLSESLWRIPPWKLISTSSFFMPKSIQPFRYCDLFRCSPDGQMFVMYGPTEEPQQQNPRDPPQTTFAIWFTSMVPSRLKTGRWKGHVRFLACDWDPEKKMALVVTIDGPSGDVQVMRFPVQEEEEKEEEDAASWSWRIPFKTLGMKQSMPVSGVEMAVSIRLDQLYLCDARDMESDLYFVPLDVE